MGRASCLKSVCMRSVHGAHDPGSTPLNRSDRDRRRGGPCINESLRCRLHAKVQPLERARPEQDEVGLLAEHDLVDGPDVPDVDVDRASPPRQDSSIRLSKVPDLSLLNSKFLENRPRKP